MAKVKLRVIKASKPYGYEKINSVKDGVNFRIYDADDNRIATSYIEENAQLIVQLMNKGLTTIPAAA